MKARLQPILLLLGLLLLNIGGYVLDLEVGIMATGFSLVVLSFPVGIRS